MATTTLGSKAVGGVVKLKVNGTAREFIIVHKGKPSSIYDSSFDNGVILLMKDLYETLAWHSSNLNDYANSAIHSYLKSTFLGLFEKNIQDAIKQVKVPYRPGRGTSQTVNSGANGLSAKIFLLSGYEVGWTSSTSQYFPEDGAVLDYFKGTASTDAKRIGYLNGTAAIWWLRSPYTRYDTGVWYVLATGNYNNGDCSNSRGVRPALVLPSTLLVSDDGTVTTNTAPTAPSSITVPSGISGGTTITVSWSASTDAEGNLAGYEAQKSIDGGSQWTQIYRAQSTATQANDNVVFGTPSVMYRVKAFDSGGLESGWRVSSNIPVVNNLAPTAPASITVPLTVLGGSDLVVSWGAATDSDGNLAGYELERQVDGQDWERIYRGDNLAFTDSITKGWETVTYRVRAYDDLDVTGPYATSQTRTVNNNTAPAVTCDYPSGSDLGLKDTGFVVTYSVDDEDGDAVTVTEAIDGVVKRSFEPTLGQNCSFQITGETFMRVLNGRHTLTITAGDGKAATVHTLTFEKKVTHATITLETPMDADDEITLAILSVIGSIPADADYTVEVTNNGKDEPPAWQDVTAEVKSGVNIVFANHTAGNGFAFNFRITVERGTSGVGGYITSVQGGFQ